MSKKPLSLTEGKVSAALLRFALPFLAANVLQSLYGAIDLLIIGRYCDSAAISAVSIGSQVMMTLLSLIVGVATGGTVLIGQKMGEEDREKAARAFGATIMLCVIMALAATPLMLAGTPEILGVMNTPSEAMEDAKDYLLICSCGIPFILGYNALSGYFRGIGDSKTPMVFVFISSCVNLAGDIALVGALGMGAAGAALATVFSQLISFASALIYIVKKGLPFKFGIAYLRPEGRALLFILKVGVPLAAQEMLVNISFLLVTTMVNELGVTASASVGVVEKILGFVMMPPVAICSAVTTMTAQNIGAKKPERALKSLKCGILYSLVFGVAITALALSSAETVVGIFTGERTVIEMAATYLRPYSIDCIIICVVFVMNGYFSGCGKSFIAFAHSMVATFAFRVPLCYLSLARCAASGTLTAMGWCMPIASLSSLVITGAYFFWIRKKGFAQQLPQAE